ncbi:hypothetical protein V5799_000694 [Amblyomma americanum]|uniref:Uncharacterized protein n=1 Tax=Amblyomma americanum TaxID=6943 RepID=A0AAQ4D2A8_AMBAM
MLQTAEVCQKVKNGVPLTMERCFSELTAPERFAIYDYVVERAKATNKSSAVKLEDLQISFEKKADEDKQRPPSELELKSQMRDYKRRRQSYRAKNVHITRKTYTEILREVIENQTEYLKQLQTDDDTGDLSSRSSDKVDAGKQLPPRHVRDQRDSSVVSSSSKRKRSCSPRDRGEDRKHPSDSRERRRSSERHEHKKHHRSHHHHHHKSKHKHKHKSKDTERIE